MSNTKPKALIFDVFGSLVDWRTGVADFCNLQFDEKEVSFDPFEFADCWRSQYQPAMDKIRSGNRGYVPLDILHKENLDIVLETTGLSYHFNASERQQLNKAWEHLPSWPHVSSDLRKLQKQSLLAPCSNGSVALMIRLARFADLSWDTIVGAETAKDYKPNFSVYRSSCASLGFQPEEVMMVAAHNNDLKAARAAGLQTGFFPRPFEHGPGQTSDLEPDDNWDFVGKNTHDLVAFMQFS